MTEDLHKTGLPALKRAADEGAENAKLDAQGFLREEPKSDSVQLTEYDKLRQKIYEWAFENPHDGVTQWLFAFLDDFPSALHQLEEGVRDAHKRNRKDTRAIRSGFSRARLAVCAR